MLDNIKELEDKIKDLEKSNAYLQSKLYYYEQNGSTNLFFSLQRKANEMAQLLNKTSLLDIDLIDAKDKSFERLQKIWNDAASITEAIKALGLLAGINEEKKEVKKPFVDTIAEKRL